MPGRDWHVTQDVPDPCFAVPFCPICGVGQMRMTYRAARLAVCVCMNCETTLSVPDSAWPRTGTDKTTVPPPEPA